MPDQPGDGQVKYVPLGGGGFRSPKQLARVLMNVTGDASGGTMTISLKMDPQYVTVCSWLRLVQSDSTAIAMEINVLPDAGMGVTFALSADNLDGYSGSNVAFAHHVTWVPPPVILEKEDSNLDLPFISCVKNNANTQVFKLNAEFYLFDKRVRELGAAEDMLALIGRGGSRFFANAS